jgi:SPP1 gp7 family putative phage head morphogenesis protein
VSVKGIELKQVGHGDAQVDYGSEKPRYGALRRQIERYYNDLIVPLDKLKSKAEIIIGVAFAKVADDEPFRYNAARRRLMDAAISTFLDDLAGVDRSEEGFIAGGIESDTPDGIIQQHNVMAYAVGLQRGSDLLNVAQTLTAARNNPATEKMLENAFARLSQNGQMRLEEVRDEIHSILASGAQAGLSPLDVSRQLSARFDEYSAYEFQRLARTEAAFASEEGAREQMEELGVTTYTVLVDASACSICQGYVGQIIPADGDLPPYHPNCLCASAPAGIGELLLG